MECPQCGARLKCPCKACKERNPDATGIYWVVVPYLDSEMCPECRFIAHIDWWEMRDWDIYKTARDSTPAPEEG